MKIWPSLNGSKHVKKGNLLDSRSIYAWIYTYIYIYTHIYIYIYANIISILHLQYTYDALFPQPSLFPKQRRCATPVPEVQSGARLFCEVLVKFLWCKIGGVPSPKPSWNFVPGSLSFHPWPLYWLEVRALFWGVGCASKIEGILEPTNLSTKNWHKHKKKSFFWKESHLVRSCLVDSHQFVVATLCQKITEPTYLPSPKFM